MPSTLRVPNTNFYRAARPRLPRRRRRGLRPLGRRPDRGARSRTRAPTPSPRSSSSRCRTPAAASRRRPGYFQRVREICDEYDVLLVSDEVICAFGRLGHMFGAERYGYQPDIITCAKGLTSGYSPARRDDRHRPADGAVQAGTALVRPRLHLRRPPGLDRGRDGQPRHLRARGPHRARARERGRRSAPPSRSCTDLPIVGDVRGDGYFYGIELVKDKATKETFDDEESERLLRGFLSGALFEAGLYCRADDRGDPVDPARAPADHRPAGLRRDRAAPAYRPDRGARAHVRRRCASSPGDRGGCAA